MVAKEKTNCERHGTDNISSRVVEVVVNGMHRAASVDDLFAPLCGLNVHASGEGDQHASAPPAQPSPAPPSSQICNATMTAALGEAPSALRKVSIGPVKSPVPPRKSLVSSSATEAEELLGPEAKAQVFSEECSQQQGDRGRDSEPPVTLGGNSSSCSASQLNLIDARDVEHTLFSSGPCPAFPAGTGGILPPGKLHSGRGGIDATLPPSQSTSDDEQLNGPGLDERKQKRMLSNRESARRSRLRKQQHLDELRAQVARMRAENTDMMARYGIASQRFLQITGENVVLRAHAADLSRKLHQVHHELATEHPNGLRPLGIQTGQMDHFSAGLPIYNH